MRLPYVAVFMALCTGLLVPVLPARADDSQAIVQLYQKVSNLQQQVRDLRGQNQALAHEIENLRNRQRQLYMSTDQRLQALEAASSAGGSSSQASAPAASTTTNSGALPAASTSPQVSAVPVPSSSTGTSAAASPTTAASNGADLAAYQKAFDLLKNSHYQASIDAFQAFEKKYPKSPYVANAEYWTGEALYVEKQYSQALVQFQKVVSDYPQSNKVAASLLKVGYSQYELQQWTNARKTLQSVVSQYPGTTAARLAADRLSQMQREGH